MTKAFAITCYHSLKDPIIEGLLLRYLQEINRREIKYCFILITFEQTKYLLSETEQRQVVSRLEDVGIIWKPLRYRTGGPLILLKKLHNFLAVWMCLLKVQRHYSIQGMMGFTSISGAIAAVLGRIFFKPIIIYCFEPHSQYQVDFGIWSQNSVKYQILRWLEKYQVKKANHIIVPTSYGVKLIKFLGTNAKIHIMPVSVDENLFTIDHQARETIRSKLNLENRRVIFYLGKFGGIYYDIETIASFYKQLTKQSDEYHFLTITTSPMDELNECLLSKGLTQDQFTTLSPIPYREVTKYINAADLGMLAVPSLPSQKYRTPIKTANYLLCGLPYLVNPGVAEDDLIAINEKVGLVANIEDDSIAGVIHEACERLLKDENITEHCREVGLRYRKLSNTTEILDKIFKSLTIPE